MMAPPSRAQAPGVSRCTTQAHTGLSTGSSSRITEASSAGMLWMALVTKTYASAIWNTPRYPMMAQSPRVCEPTGSPNGSETRNAVRLPETAAQCKQIPPLRVGRGDHRLLHTDKEEHQPHRHRQHETEVFPPHRLLEQPGGEDQQIKRCGGL